MVAKGDIMDFTIFPVQAWMDLPAIASRIITHGTDPEKAKRCANKLAAALFAMRDAAQTPLTPVEEILDIAEANTTNQPVILAEPADSPNGGCVGDSPIVPLALQKRSSEVWQVLGAVRTEFDKFGETLEKAQKRLDDANRELDQLVGVRTRQIQKKLRSVERIEDPTAANALLSIDEG